MSRTSALHPETGRGLQHPKAAVYQDMDLNVGDALQIGRDWLAGIESGRQDALLLLGRVMGRPKEWLLAHPEQTLEYSEQTNFARLVGERAAGRPLPYLLGEWWFYGRSFLVTPGVLIPRPETEELVETAALFLAKRSGRQRIVDIGTGSGVIAISLALAFPDAEVLGVDLAQDALDVAVQNAARLGAENMRWVLSDLFDSVRIPPGGFDLVAANLPYIPTADLDDLAVARHEPLAALDGGQDGLRLIRRLLAAAPAVLAPDGALLLEIEERQGPAVLALSETAFPGALSVLKQDLAGRDRIVMVLPAARTAGLQ